MLTVHIRYTGSRTLISLYRIHITQCCLCSHHNPHGSDRYDTSICSNHESLDRRKERAGRHASCSGCISVRHADRHWPRTPCPTTFSTLIGARHQCEMSTSTRHSLHDQHSPTLLGVRPYLMHETVRSYLGDDPHSAIYRRRTPSLVQLCTHHG